MEMKINGILLIYHHPLAANAPTIMEHVESFERYSKHDVWKVNTEYGFPAALRDMEFSAIVLHYSVFGMYPFILPMTFRRYVEGCKRSVKVAFFQDEYDSCRERFALIDRLGIDVLYTLMEPRYFDEIYVRNTGAKRVLPTLTGYVCDTLLENANRFAKSFAMRRIDVGYRGRPLPFYMGRGAQEKTNIGKEFAARCANSNLRLDIRTDEGDRIYGSAWHRFIGECRFMLGVESGVSIFDVGGSVVPKLNEYLRVHPGADFEEVEAAVLAPYEDRIYYRTISPRVLEAAAFRTCQIMFEGKYQGILQPGRHYIELKKDFSNLDDVLRQMKDESLVTEIVENAHRDLIASGAYHYSKFIASFDEMLHECGCFSEGSARSAVDYAAIDRALNGVELKRLLKTYVMQMRFVRFPGRPLVKRLAYALGYRRVDA
jgi:hypothetical protein